MAGVVGRLDTDSIRALPHYGASFFRNRFPHLTATLPRRANPTFALCVVFGAEKIFKWPWQ